jgi:hypothetical protein
MWVMKRCDWLLYAFHKSVYDPNFVQNRRISDKDIDSAVSLHVWLNI